MGRGEGGEESQIHVLYSVVVYRGWEAMLGGAVEEGAEKSRHRKAQEKGTRVITCSDVHEGVP